MGEMMSTNYVIAKTDAKGRVEKYERGSYSEPAAVLEAARKLSEHWPVERIRIFVSYSQLYKLDDFERVHKS